MKILMTSESFLPRLGGAEIHIKEIIENLELRGHEVFLLTNEERVDNFDSFHKVLRIAWRNKKNKRNIFQIFNILWKESKNSDIIHSHYCYRLAFFAGIVARLRRKPIIVVLHGMGILDEQNVSLKQNIIHSFYRYFSLQLATVVVSTSKDLAEIAKKYISEKKMIIISNGYNSDKFHPNITISPELFEKYKDKKIIITVRRLTPKNGIHYLVEAIPYIKEKIPNFLYLIIGDGRMVDHIDKRINELNIGNFIERIGMIDNNLIPQYLKLSDVVVFPSTAESSSIACSEAMAMGKKIVASRVGGLIELLGENGERGKFVNLVDWTESSYDAPMTLEKEKYQHLADVIVKALQEEDRSNNYISEYAKNNLSWSSITNSTEKLYNQLRIR